MTTVLVAVDGSISSERAVHVGADVAKSRNAEVVLVSAIDDQPIPDSVKLMAETEHVVDRAPPAHAPTAANMTTWMMEGIHAAAQAEENIELRWAVSRLAMEKARSILGDLGLTPTKELVLEGNAADVILATADGEGAEMIVMGTRGLGKFESLIFGSTSRQVADEAECTCVTVT